MVGRLLVSEQVYIYQVPDDDILVSITVRGSEGG